jgi:hypothetical protein
MHMSDKTKSAAAAAAAAAQATPPTRQQVPYQHNSIGQGVGMRLHVGQSFSARASAHSCVFVGRCQHHAALLLDCKEARRGWSKHQPGCPGNGAQPQICTSRDGSGIKAQALDELPPVCGCHSRWQVCLYPAGAAALAPSAPSSSPWLAPLQADHPIQAQNEEDTPTLNAGEMLYVPCSLPAGGAGVCSCPYSGYVSATRTG